MSTECEVRRPGTEAEADKCEHVPAPHPLFKRLKYSAPSSEFFDRTLLEVDEATNTVRLRYHAPPQSANIRGDVQGGFVAAMLDSASGCALVAALPWKSFGVSLDMNITYISPTPIGELFGTGRLIHMGSTVAFVEGELRTPLGKLTARCTATLRVVHERPLKQSATETQADSPADSGPD